jgi:hypothetical protein
MTEVSGVVLFEAWLGSHRVKDVDQHGTGVYSGPTGFQNDLKHA